MSSPFVAEIRIFPFNFAPVGWARCDGQILPISQNTALFSLLGTMYGGDGKSTFALPDLNGGLATHAGANQPGPGLKFWDQGELTGDDTVTLIQSEMPAHNHLYTVTTDEADIPAAAGAQTAKAAKGNPVTGLTQARMYSTVAPQTLQHLSQIGVAGGNQPHNNMMPYLTLLYCIALQGVFPPRG